MARENIPYGNAMKMEVSFANANAVEIAPGKKLVYIAGQMAFDENDNLVGVGDIKVQTEQVLKNIKKHMESFGGTLDDILNVTVYVSSMDGLEKIHEVRKRYFNKPYPSSTLVQISNFVNPDGLIEINAQAVIEKKP